MPFKLCRPNRENAEASRASRAGPSSVTSPDYGAWRSLAGSGLPAAKRLSPACRGHRSEEMGRDSQPARHVAVYRAHAEPVDVLHVAAAAENVQVCQRRPKFGSGISFVIGLTCRCSWCGEDAFAK